MSKIAYKAFACEIIRRVGIGIVTRTTKWTLKNIAAEYNEYQSKKNSANYFDNIIYDTDLIGDLLYASNSDHPE